MRELPVPTGLTTVQPIYRELPLDQDPGPAATVPWHLIRVDHQENRVYVSASTVACTVPEKVRLSESSTEIAITVTGSGGNSPCTALSTTMVGYVQIGSIGERRVTGNS